MSSLRLFATQKSAGRRIVCGDQNVVVEDTKTADFEGIDIARFSNGSDTSRWLAAVVAEAGATVIDNSSAWRGHDQVPLVVADVNAYSDCRDLSREVRLTVGMTRYLTSGSHRLVCLWARTG